MATGVRFWIGEDYGTLAEVVATLRPDSSDPLHRRTVVVPNAMVGQWLEQRLARINGAHRDGDGVVANLDVILPTAFVDRVLYGTSGRLASWLSAGLAMQILATRSRASELSWVEARRRARALADVLFWRPERFDEYLAMPENARERAAVVTLRARGCPTPWDQLDDCGLAPRRHVSDDVIVFGCQELTSGALVPRVVELVGRRSRIDVLLATPSVDVARRASTGESADSSLVDRWGLSALAHLRTWRETCATAEVTWLDTAIDPSSDRGEVRRCLADDHATPRASLRRPFVEVHGAVGYARQVEIARDAVLHAIDDLGLLPHEVRVVTTDAARFAPLMRALWTTRFRGDEHRPGLQFEIADPSMPRASDRLHGFTQLLRTVDSHFTLHDVVALVSEPSVQLALGLSRRAAERILELAVSNGVSLGLDAGSRAIFGVFDPEDDVGTWRRFADRGLLASVFDPDSAGSGGTIGPLGVPDDLFAVAQLSRLVTVLSDARREIAQDRSITRWHETFDAWAQVVARGPDVIDNGLERVMERLAALGRECDAPLTFFEARELFAHAAEELGGSSLLGRGGATVQSIDALASAPYRLTCLIGFDEELLPQPNSPAAHLGAPEGADPSARNRFRSALLSTILSTSERVILLTNDRSVRDGSTVSPCIALAELERALSPSTGDGASAALTWRRHPRHAFTTKIPAAARDGVVLDVAARDSAGPDAFTFDPATSRLATRLHNRGAPRLEDDLAVPGSSTAGLEGPSVLDLSKLIRFVKDPQREFLRNALHGASVPDGGLELPDTPRLSLASALVEWSLRQAAVALALSSGSSPSLGVHPDDPLGAIATGLRPSVEAGLNVSSLASFVEHYRADLASVGARRIPESLYPALLPGLEFAMTRPPIELYETTGGPLVIEWTTSKRFTTPFLTIFAAMAAATVELGGPVAAVMVRPRAAKKGDSPEGPSPYLILRWATANAVASAIAALTTLRGLYLAQFSELPLHSFRTSLSGSTIDSLRTVFANSARSEWEGSDYAGAGPGEMARAANRLLLPFTFDELREVRDGAFLAASARLQSVFRDVVARQEEKPDGSWTLALSGAHPPLEDGGDNGAL